MIIKILAIIMLAALAHGCDADTKSGQAQIEVSAQENVFEKTLVYFSEALVKKDLNLFTAVSDSKELSVVRRFTSGNLGGRGEPFSDAIPISQLKSNLAFDIKNQTPFEIPGLFMNFPIKSFGELPQRQLVAEAEDLDFYQWESVLKSSLQGAPEVQKGDSILLVSSKYWVYTEAQIITDILVGGFAVFEKRDGKLKLVALIELL